MEDLKCTATSDRHGFPVGLCHSTVSFNNSGLKDTKNQTKQNKGLPAVL